VGTGERIPYFALLAHTAFVCLSVKLSLSQPMSFFTFTLLILSPIPLEGSEQAALWCLAAGWD